MKTITVKKYVCDFCERQHDSVILAKMCEKMCKQIRKATEINSCKLTDEQEKIKKLESKGFAVWFEDGNLKYAKKINPKEFGRHQYDSGHTSDCAYGCGCWMGSFRSGGRVDPFGACPNNPIKR